MAYEPTLLPRHQGSKELDLKGDKLLPKQKIDWNSWAETTFMAILVSFLRASEHQCLRKRLCKVSFLYRILFSYQIQQQYCCNCDVLSEPLFTPHKMERYLNCVPDECHIVRWFEFDFVLQINALIENNNL